MKPNKLRTIALLVTASFFVGIGAAYAATLVVTGHVRFLTHITITQVADPDFGSVSAGIADTYTLSTAGGVTAAGGPTHIEGGAPAAGSYTLVASTAQGINIFCSGYTAQGVSTPSALTCSYNAGAETACASGASPLAIASPLASANLKVGLKVTTTAAGTDNESDTPTLTLNVVYQ